MPGVELSALERAVAHLLHRELGARLVSINGGPPLGHCPNCGRRTGPDDMPVLRYCRRCTVEEVAWDRKRRKAEYRRSHLAGGRGR